MTNLLLRRSMMTLGGGGVPLADLPEGTGIFLEEGGVQTEYMIACTNYPTDSENLTGRTLLLRRGVYGVKAMGGSSYRVSDMNEWLNDEFLSLLGTGVQQQIEAVKILVAASSSGSLQAMEAKVFLLSYTEVGGTGSSFPVMGCALPYFSENARRIAFNSEEERATWWLRTQRLSATTFAIVSGEGTLNGYGVNTALRGVRPAFTLPQNALAIPNGQGSYQLAV